MFSILDVSWHGYCDCGSEFVELDFHAKVSFAIGLYGNFI